MFLSEAQFSIVLRMFFDVSIMSNPKINLRKSSRHDGKDGPAPVDLFVCYCSQQSSEWLFYACLHYPFNEFS